MLKKKIAIITMMLAACTAFAQDTRESLEDAREARRLRREQRAREEREDRIAEKNERRLGELRPAVKYGDNFLRIAPLRILDIGGVGIGAEYERLLGENKMIGVVFPVTIVFEETSVNWNFNEPNDGLHYNVYYYFCPGVKIYPFGQRKVTYAVGPSLMAGWGSGKEWKWTNTDPNGNGYYKEVDKSKLSLGMIVMNYVNFQVTKNFSLGIDAGLGMRYYDREKTGLSTNNEGFSPTGQFSLTLGFRF